jgi:hypothetical protein
MRLKPIVYGIVVISLFLGIIYTAQAVGFWSVSGKVTASGEKVQPTGSNVSEIKGWMTLGDLAGAYKIPLEEMVKAFNLPADTPPTRQIKELESATFSTTALRTWIQERMSKTPVP